MLAEIRICFDKTLKLIDCGRIKKSIRKLEKLYPLTNCIIQKPILYLDYIPEHNISISSNSINSNTL